MENNCNCESKIISVSKKDLQIFRGTYEEVMKQPTVNMKIYLAWDTQQLFVGNSRGIKTPYSGAYESVIKKYITDLRSEVYDSIDTKVDEKIDEALADIESSVIDTLTKTFEGEIASLVKDNVSEFDEKISKNENAIGALSLQINGTNSKITENSEKIQALSDKVDAAVSSPNLAYKTGQEIAKLAENPSTFKPVFCTSSYGNYIIGRIYYADGNTIKAMAGGSGGSSGKVTTVDAGLSLAISPTTTYIPMTSDTAYGYVVTPAASNDTIVSEYSFDGKTYSSLSGVVATGTINRTTPNSRTFKLNATTKESPEGYEYTAKEASITLTVYKPWFFGNDGNLVQYAPNSTTFTADITDGEHVYLYATNNNLSFKYEYFEVPVDGTSEATHSFSGLTDVSGYIKYDFGVIHDTTMTIERK